MHMTFRQTFALIAAATLLVVSTTDLQAQINPNDPFGVNRVVNPGSNVYSTVGPGAVNPNPYSTTPFANAGAGGAFNNPWMNPWFNPYWGIGREGGALLGASAVIDAQGQFMLNEEYARMYRQKARQEQLNTIKMKFDLEKYIRDNRPTFTDDQIKAAATRLERIRQVAQPSEIWSGQALNILMKDLNKHIGKSSNVSSVSLSEDVLRRLNVTSGANGGNLGVLRNGGKIEWPIALIDLLPEQTREDISGNAEQLVNLVANNKVNVNLLKDLNSEIQGVSENLVKNVNEIPTSQYLEAKRFMEDLKDAVRALSNRNVAQDYFQFQNFVKGGKTSEEVTQYMLKNGLTFAPSTEGDEAAYQAMYSALANLDLAFNTQVAAGPVPQK